MTGTTSSFGHHGSGGVISSHHSSCHGSTFSNEGSSGAFGPGDDDYRGAQNHSWYPVYENPPLIVQSHHERPRRSSRRAKSIWWSFTASIGTVLGSLWMLFGLYGSEHLEMGLNYSRLLRANRLFVQGISIQNREPAPGPILYGFQNQPSLDDEKEWTVDHRVTLPSFYHKEWSFWLNKRSKLKLEYNAISTSSLFLVITQGKDNYMKWIQDTGNPDWCLLWRPVHGHGHITFETTEDDDYYIGIANLHQTSMEMVLKIEIKAKVYETAEAAFWCPLDAKPCTIALSLKGSEVGLLTTPDKPQEDVDVWYMTVSYNTRWATYIIIYGALGLILLSIYSCQKKSKRRAKFYSEIAPMSLQTGAAAYFGAAPTVGNSCPYDEPNINSSEADRVRVEIPEENLCTICFEEQKNSFFQPCGHCATCYNCGLRIKEMSPECPICRQPIQEIGKIYIT